MKYTSPYKPSKSKTPNFKSNNVQNTPHKQMIPAQIQQKQDNTSIRTYDSRSTNISYFQQSKYKVKDIKQTSPTKHQSKQRQPESSSDRFGKINKLIQNITNKHQEMRSKLNHLRQNTSNNQENTQQCTFTPHIIHNPRYVIPSSLSERIKDWGQSKARHYTSIRQELISQQIKECTFSPKLIAKPRSAQILKDKVLQSKRVKQTKLYDRFMDEMDSQIKQKQQVRPVKQKKTNQIKYRAVDVKNIRGLIKYEMSRINFDF